MFALFFLGASELDQPAHVFRLTRFNKLTSCDYCKGYIISIVAKDNYMCDGNASSLFLIRFSVF
jgi:hypothetical protein